MMRKSAIFDLIGLLALGIYRIAGMPITPFHGDETIFLHGQPQALMFNDPHTDGTGYLRIPQGSLIHFSIGLTLNAALLSAALAFALVLVALNVAVVLINPLPWQRYFLAIIPLVILLTRISIAGRTGALYRLRAGRLACESGKESHFRLLWRSYLPLDSLDGGALHDDDSAPAEN
ncbi:MAG: hypothetical protein ABI835_04280 [Chloroflexota bacterium]